jgi:hypothetical protein
VKSPSGSGGDELLSRKEHLMKSLWKLPLLVMAIWGATAQAGDVDGKAVIGGAVGGGAGAAVGSAVGGREGAIIGGAIGGGVGAAIATQPSKETPKVTKQVVVKKKVVHERKCWPPGHCKHKHKHYHHH